MVTDHLRMLTAFSHFDPSCNRRYGPEGSCFASFKKNPESSILLHFQPRVHFWRDFWGLSKLNGDTIFFLSSCPWLKVVCGREVCALSHLTSLRRWFSDRQGSWRGLSFLSFFFSCLTKFMCGQSTSVSLFPSEDHADRGPIWFLAEQFYSNWGEWSLFLKSLSLGPSVAGLTVLHLPSNNSNNSTPPAFSGLVC